MSCPSLKRSHQKPPAVGVREKTEAMIEDELITFTTELIPDPEGYPIYRDIETGKIYRCISWYCNSSTLDEWYVFDIVEEQSGDTLFAGLHISRAGHPITTFYHTKVLGKCRVKIEFDPVDLQGLQPPLIGLDERGRDILWKKLDGPVKFPEDLKTYLT